MEEMIVVDMVRPCGKGDIKYYILQSTNDYNRSLLQEIYGKLMQRMKGEGFQKKWMAHMNLELWCFWAALTPDIEIPNRRNFPTP